MKYLLALALVIPIWAQYPPSSSGNAKSILGKPICQSVLTATDGQMLTWSTSSACWVVSSAGAGTTLEMQDNAATKVMDASKIRFQSGSGLVWTLTDLTGGILGASPAIDSTTIPAKNAAGTFTSKQIFELFAITPSTAPATPTSGQAYVDSTANVLFSYNGSAWKAYATNPGTTLGDIFYCSDTATPCTLTRLAANTSGYFLRANGAGAAPSYAIPAASQISGLAASATTDALNASNISSGTLAPARMGSGTPDNTTYLRGDGAWETPAGGGSSSGSGTEIQYRSGAGTFGAIAGSATDNGGITVSGTGLTTLQNTTADANTVAPAANQRISFKTNVASTPTEWYMFRGKLYTPAYSAVTGPALTFGDPGGTESSGYLGTGIGQAFGVGNVGIWASHSPQFVVTSKKTIVAADGFYTWSSNTTLGTGVDTALSRTGGGVVEVNNGTALKLRDLRFRVITNGGWGAGSEGGCNTYTDLAVDGTLNTKVTSASYNFVAADVGSWVDITSGSGWTTGRYVITTVASNAATLDSSPAAVNTTGGTFLTGWDKVVHTHGTPGSTADTFRICALGSGGTIGWQALF